LSDNAGSARQRPFVTLKYAQTLDGRIATAEGHSQWISGAETRTLAHELRANHQGVLVGVGTVLTDDPQLTTRLCEGTDPLRVVVDSQLKTPLTATVLTDNPNNTLIATTLGAPAERRKLIEATGAKILDVPSGEKRVDLHALLWELYQLGIGSVLVEGGAGIITAFLGHGLVDELVVVVAPKIIGRGLEAVGDLGIKSMDQALTFESYEVERVGEDVLIRGRPLASDTFCNTAAKDRDFAKE
jgi:diaminohydroxyphosphoribosylaminopyrimidine deaminase / 5-amino-6-(5-phosphoribosylamino)uracil reductase